MKKNNFLTKAFTLLFVLLFNLTGARAIVTHTVYDGTATNNTVPVNGAQVYRNFTRSQFIIPSTQLQIMKGGKISHMIFYTIASQDVINWYSSSSSTTENLFDVYVSETAASTINSYQTWGNLTKVYSGKLAVNGNQMIVDFNSAFSYSGGNLLIGIRQTNHRGNVSDSSPTSTFLGQSVNGASISSYTDNVDNNGTAEQQNFIPKTTFVYTPGFIPTNIEVTKKEVVNVPTIEGNPEAVNVTLSWEGSADSYEVRYRTQRDLLSQDFTSGIPSTWTVWKKGEAPDINPFRNGWGAYEGTASSYSWYPTIEGSGWWSQDTPAQAYAADNWLISPKVELGGILRFKVGVTAWHDKYEVKIATVANIANADVSVFNKPVRELAPGIPGTEDFDLKDYSGQEGYIAIHHLNTDGYWISIDDFELSAGHAWKTAKTQGNETSIVLERLLPDLWYEFVVIGVKHDDVNNVDVKGEAPNDHFSTIHADDIIIPDDEDNESLVYDVAQLCKNGRTYNAYLEKRSFADNGIWNTLTLPFDVTVAGSPFEGAAIYTVLDRSSVTNDVLTLRLDPVSNSEKLIAGTPYFITWEGAKGLVEPHFNNVTFKNETHPKTCGVTGGTSIVFTPNFNLLKYTKEDKSILFLNNNNLYYVDNGSRIKPQRAYFQRSGASSVRGIVFEIVDDDADGINDVNANLNVNENIYNVAGQRLGQMQKGINIVNGKKIIIK